jgi:hypothetical protein
MGNGESNEFDLKIAILQAAMKISARRPAEEDPSPTADRRFVLTTIRLLNRSFGLEADAPAAVED